MAQASIPKLAATILTLPIAQPARKRVALRLADLHDRCNGLVSTSMGELARATGLSENQARRHVHALVADGVIAVVANAHGGDPGKVPRYRFVHDRLAAMANGPGSHQDMFQTTRREDAASSEHVFWTDPNTEFYVRLIGAPGRRQVAFWLCGGRPKRYGSVPLARLLADPTSPDSWDGVLVPFDKPHCAQRDLVQLPDDVVNKLAHWAQNAALGRIESIPA